MLKVLYLALLVVGVKALRIYDEGSDCYEDSQKLCAGAKNEFAVVSCLQKEIDVSNSAVSKLCHQALWDFKNNVMTSTKYVEQMNKQCQPQVDKYCKGVNEGDVIACILAKRLDIENTVETTTCKRYLKAMAFVFFSDYHLVKDFVVSCSEDVRKFSCGTVATSIGEASSSSQGKVISCLEKRINKLSPKCKAVLSTKEEESADSFELDKALYRACRKDRTALCADTPDSAGEVYNCLGRYKFNRRLSPTCRDEVVRRQLMSLEDFKVDYELMTTCGADLVTQNCLNPKMTNRLQEGFLRTVLLMQCLTEINEMEDKTRHPVSQKCLREISKVKRMIMGDIELTPELGIRCHDDVAKSCSSVPKTLESGIINCLMEQASQNNLVAECQDMVEMFVEEVDPISDYQLNYALMVNCGSVVDDHCHKDQGEGEVMSCLMDLELMMDLPVECSQQVLSYKYFTSRSIKLDKPLYKACSEDAKDLCKTEFTEIEKPDAKPKGAVISCLYHHLYMDEDIKLSAKCTPELKRVIIAQGESVNLTPSLQAGCTRELVEFCSGTGLGRDDYGCLETALIGDKIESGSDCYREMEIYAMRCLEDVRYDYRLMRACRGAMREKCEAELGEPTHGALLGCLEMNKQSLPGACKKHVLELQLVSLYDYKFNTEFVESCNTAVQHYCAMDKSGPIKRKQDVMYCLRDELQNEKQNGKDLISTKCKEQLRQEFKKQMKDLDLDPQLLSACSVDLKDICRLDLFEDKLEVMECLRKHEETLTPSCKDKVFERELQQAEDPEIDPVLMKNCRNTINKYCSGIRDPEDLMACLEENQHNNDMGNMCKSTIKLRMLKEHSNYQLNIGLKKSCRADIKFYCGEVLRDIKSGAIKDARGKVVSCLKDNMDKVSVECEASLSKILEQEVQNYKLDPILSRFCQDDIADNCANTPEDQVEGCLRERIMSIRSEDCTKQVIRLISEAHNDAHLDPVLMRACQRDIGYLCGRIRPGHGQVVECLQSNQQRDKNSLSPTCAKMIETRVNMWSNAYKKAKEYDSSLEVMNDLYLAVESSKFKHELLAYLGLALFVLVMLSFCGGRCTKKPKPASKLY